MTRWRRSGPRPPRIPITLPDPVDEARRLRGLIHDILGVIDTLEEQVRQLRPRLAQVRGRPTDPTDTPVPSRAVPRGTDDPVADAARLNVLFDALHDHADALWFERQWLTAQIEVAQARDHTKVPRR